MNGARFAALLARDCCPSARDALIADISPSHVRGASFGLRQSLDTVGAFLGPLMAMYLMWLTAENFTSVFWVAVIPAFLSFVLILAAVREPDRPASLRQVRMPLSRGELGHLSSAYWWIVIVATLFVNRRRTLIPIEVASSL